MLRHVPLDEQFVLTPNFGASPFTTAFSPFKLACSNGKASPQMYGVDIFRDFGIQALTLLLFFHLTS
jgi:hypothetical protein